MAEDLPNLRASHADRERVVDALRVAAGEGRLSAEELDSRLETALSARTMGELAGLTADLPTKPAFLSRDVLVVDNTAASSPARGAGRYRRESSFARSCAESRSTSPRR